MRLLSICKLIGAFVLLTWTSAAHADADISPRLDTTLGRLAIRIR